MKARQLIPAFYGTKAVLFLVSGAAIASTLGLIADRTIILVDSGAGETVVLMQAIFGAQIGLGVLIATALGITLQLRISSIGSDNARLFLASPLLLAAGVLGVGSWLWTGAILGNWDDLTVASEGLILDLAIAFCWPHDSPDWDFGTCSCDVADQQCGSGCDHRAARGDR